MLWQRIQPSGELVYKSTELLLILLLRLVKLAADQNKPISLLSIGPSRGDPIVSEGLRFDLPCTPVLTGVARQLASHGNADNVLSSMLSSGVTREVDTKGRYTSAS